MQLFYMIVQCILQPLLSKQIPASKSQCIQDMADSRAVKAGESKGRSGNGLLGKGDARSWSPRSGGKGGKGGQHKHGQHNATSTVDSLKGQLDDVALAVGVVAQIVRDQVMNSSIATVGPPAITTVEPPAGSTDRDILVPRATAHRLNEALLRAVQSSQQMRQALEIYDRAARGNEALLERAQRALSNLLCGSD
jgi:hypothetical protein